MAGLTWSPDDLLSKVVAAHLESAIGRPMALRPDPAELAEPAALAEQERSSRRPPIATFYVIANPHAPMDVRHSCVAAPGVTIDGADRVVIGDHARVDSTTTYVLDRIEVDAKRFMSELSGRAQEALSRLVENPDDHVANAAFRRTLRPVETAEQGPLHHESEVSLPVEVTTLDCDVVAIGTHQTHELEQRIWIGTAKLDLAGLMKDDEHVAQAFARQLAEGESPGQRLFGKALTSTVSRPEHLPGIVSAVPGGRPW